ncbi:MAG: TldD/PmbA family protein [Saccharofermentanales bacterium]|jgi:PmbA protein
MEQLIKKANLGLDALKAGGADQASCAVSRTVVREINVEQGDFTLYRTLYEDHVSFQAIADGRRGVLSQNNVTEDAIRDGARQCLQSAEAADPDEAWQLAPSVGEHTFVEGALTCDEAKLIERFEGFLDDVKTQFPKIHLEQVIVTHTVKESAAVFSTGSILKAQRGAYEISTMFNAQESDKASSFFGNGVLFTSLDTPFIELGSIAEDFALVSDQVHTDHVTGKFEGTVLMTPDCVRGFIGSALDLFTADGSILNKTSLWLDRLGERVADPRLTISLAPHHPDIILGDRYSQEGYLSEDFSPIEHGVLKSFTISDHAARKTGYERAKNMSFNVVVEPGDTSVEAIIQGIDRGLLIARFSGGMPSSNGDFSGVAKNAFLIENGEVKEALSETMIAGNFADALMNIRAISKETVNDGSGIVPWVALDGIVISGK